MFSKPSIEKVIDSQIYEVKRLIIDAAAKLEIHRANVTKAEADLALYQARLTTLEAQRRSLVQFAVEVGQ